MPMAEVINLRQARKQLSRAKKRAEASENAAKSGRTKAQKTLETARAKKASADLDAHRRDKD